jgi:tetratricopeptide (TPR) repeat protein
VLEELKEPLGALLWQTVRDVYLWGSLHPDERGELFAPGAEGVLLAMLHAAEVEVRLETPLMALVRMVASPGTARPEAVAMACQHVAAWADEQGHSGTSIAFQQAAAAAVPADASVAYAVGRTARRRAEYARAETWFRRAIALARQSGDWTSYALAFSGLGNLYVQRGNYPAARRFHIRALRAARRHSLRQIQGNALHDLFVIAATGGPNAEAERLARAAYDAYGPEHPRLPVLAHDIAYLWMAGGHFRPALTVFEALLPHLRRHEDRMIGLANIVRAAAGVGDRHRFDEVWAEVWDGLARGDRAENAAHVLVELARGAEQVGEAERAESAAERAARVARERGEARLLLEADALLESLRRARGARARAGAPAADAPPEESDAFAADLARSLHASLVAR